MARSYNSVGAGDKPKLGSSDCCDVAGPGGGQSASRVTVVTDIPKVGGPGRMSAKSPGEPSVARPGGAQSASKS